MCHAAVLWLMSTSVVVGMTQGASRLVWDCEARKHHASPIHIGPDQQRNVLLINSCDIPVQVGFTSGAMCASCSPSLPCPEGGLCQLGRCFFPSLLPHQPSPPGNYLSLNAGQKSNITLRVSGQYGYGGALYLSTGCESYAESCESAICTGKVCDPFTGPMGPHTRAEFFMDPVGGADFYDVSLIHGVNVPISITPLKGVSPNNFTCQIAGGVQKVQNFPGCSYKFNPSFFSNEKGTLVNQSSSLVFVAVPNLASPQACNSDSNCPSPLRCGLAADRNIDGAPQSTVSRVCGRPVGIWSANEVCIYGQEFGEPFSCQQAASLQKGHNSDLYGCSGPYDFSGYGSGHGESPANVCGCVNWQQPTEAQCQFDNAEWERLASPWVRLLKQGCPTAYSYPYDDETSTFRCIPQVAAQPVAYQFEFCPSGTRVVVL